MKRRALLLAVCAAAGLFLLTACTSSEEEIAQGVRSDQGGSTGTADAGAGDSGGIQDGAGQDQAAGTQDGAGQDQAAGTQDGAGQDQNAGTETQGQTESPASTGDSETAETRVTEPPTETPGGSEGVEDIWSGTYIGEQETVTIALVDAGSFSFSFANSGIASTAAIDGYQAVYRGDDHHVVVFEVDGDTLNITVSSEEDFDASASPLNGTYVRE